MAPHRQGLRHRSREGRERPRPRPVHHRTPAPRTGRDAVPEVPQPEERQAMNDTCSKCGDTVTFDGLTWTVAGRDSCPNGGVHEVDVEQHAAQADANEQTGGLITPEEARTSLGFGPSDEEIVATQEEWVATPEIVLDTEGIARVSDWHQYFAGTPMTPVAEHEMLEAVSNDGNVRDFLASLGERMSTGLGYMEALSSMPEDDIKMVVEASTYASEETSLLISVVLQSVAVTKVS